MNNRRFGVLFRGRGVHADAALGTGWLPSIVTEPGNSRAPSNASAPRPLVLFLRILPARTLARAPSFQTFTFDRVFHPQATQAEVYMVARPLVTSAVDG